MKAAGIVALRQQLADALAKLANDERAHEMVLNEYRERTARAEKTADKANEECAQLCGELRKLREQLNVFACVLRQRDVQITAMTVTLLATGAIKEPPLKVTPA